MVRADGAVTVGVPVAIIIKFEVVALASIVLAPAPKNVTFCNAVKVPEIVCAAWPSKSRVPPSFVNVELFVKSPPTDSKDEGAVTAGAAGALIMTVLGETRALEIF